MSTSLADYKTENGVHTEALQRKLRAEGGESRFNDAPLNAVEVRAQ